MKHKHYRKKFSFLLLGLFLGLTVSGQTITKEFTKTPLKDVLKEVERQTGLSVIYKKNDINENKPITETFNATPVEKVLPRILDATADFTIQNKMIVLFKKKKQQESTASASVPKIVSGTVVYTDGEPAIGANISEKGTQNGMASDVNGKFSLQVNSDAVLVVSLIGYITQEVAVGNQTNVSITLSEDNLALEEVVIVGYGEIERKNFTGSVTTVKLDNSPISQAPRTSPADALRGTVPGLRVGREVAAGSNVALELHGQKSLSGGDYPLIVVDGMIFKGNFEDINPITVESISVLKDAASLAAYGSQAANGVIMVTSKKGVLGKPVINVSSSLAFSEKTMLPKLLSPEDYIRKTNLAMGVDDPFDWALPVIYENYKAGKVTDWIDLVTRTGVLQNYSIGISGATEKINYSMTIGHTDQTGVVIGDQYKRETVNLRLQNDITNWLQIGGQINFTNLNYDGVTALLRPYLSPYAQPFRPNGELERWTDGTAQSSGGHLENPLWNTSKGGTRDNKDRRKNLDLRGNVLIKAPWIKGLNFRMNVSYTTVNSAIENFVHEGNFVPGGEYTDDERYSPETLSRYLSSANGTYTEGANNHYVWDNILSYAAQLNKHLVSVSAVYTRDETKQSAHTMTGSDFTELGNTLLGVNGIPFASIYTVSIGKTRIASIGYLGRLSYSYDDRYHLMASIRRDGSSVFGADHKWGIFPSAGVAWLVSKESFLKDNSTVSYLKLKSSYGKNGNRGLSPYSTLSPITLGPKGEHPYVLDNNSTNSWGEYVAGFGNTDLAWETTNLLNFGFEFGLWRNRIYLELNAYHSETFDQVFTRTIPMMNNGFTTTKASMGQINNTGVEFTVNTVNIESAGFKWRSMLYFYLNRNKLVDLYGDGKDDLASSLFLGKSLGAIYGYKAIGIVQEEDTEYMTANGAKPGDAKFANLDGSEDGKITMSATDPDDRTILGYTKENFNMNMSHTFSYNNFELYAMFMGVFGGNGYTMYDNPSAFLTNYNYYNNVDHIWWTPENRSNVYPAPNFSGTNYKNLMSYAFVRLQDLSLSYTFRQKSLHDKGLKNLKVYISGKNLFTLTNWVGGDPENKQHFGRTSNLSTYPLSKTVSFGLNISF
jgi:TonB-linked SusC/RagA family outer membrane protein